MPELGLAQSLHEAVQEVLEKMFFVPEAMDLPEAVRQGLAARVSFSGSAEGVLTIVVETEAARTMAADFLAEVPEDLTEQRLCEVMGELANMVCGSVLSRVAPWGTFHLTTPDTTMMPSAEGHSTAECTVDTGAGAVTAQLAWGEASCQTADASVS